jgi:hypothetical protein
VAIYPSSTEYPSLALYPSSTVDLTAECKQDFTYRVRAVWEDAQSTSVQFDISRFDGTDEFADPLAADFNDLDPAVETIQNVESVSIRRGRDDNLESFTMGTAVITIVDEDGRYNPSNESGPLYGKLRPMRQILVTAQIADFAEVPLVRGYIRNIDYEYYSNQGRARITLNDLFIYLNKSKPVFDSVGRITNTGEVLEQILTSVAWTDASLLSLDDGDVIPSPGPSNTSADSSALSKVQELLEIERGDFYIAADGTVTFGDRNTRATKPTFASFTNVSGSAVVTSDLDRVKNRATVTRDLPDPTPDVVKTWSDSSSVANYGVQDFSSITSEIIYDDAQALSLAQWLVAQRKDPLVPFRSITIVLNTLNYLDAFYALSTDLTERVTVGNTSLGQTLSAYFVEAITHEIKVGTHSVTFSLLPIFSEVIVLNRDEAVLDEAVLAY